MSFTLISLVTNDGHIFLSLFVMVSAFDILFQILKSLDICWCEVLCSLFFKIGIDYLSFSPGNFMELHWIERSTWRFDIFIIVFWSTGIVIPPCIYVFLISFSVLSFSVLKSYMSFLRFIPRYLVILRQVFKFLFSTCLFQIVPTGMGCSSVLMLTTWG